MCCILQAEERNVSGDIEEIKIAYSSPNWIRINTEDLKNEVDTALSFAKSIDISGLADFNKTNRMRRRKPKKLDENPDSAVTVDLSALCKEDHSCAWYYAFITQGKVW